MLTSWGKGLQNERLLIILRYKGMGELVFTIQKAKIPAWGYEITAKGFHNIAPSVEAAVDYLQGRFGADVKYKVKGVTDDDVDGEAGR